MPSLPVATRPTIWPWHDSPEILALRFPPKGPAEPAAGTIIRVTVHVDDSRATKCTMSELSDAGAPLPVDTRTAVFQCREQLVVESFVVLGTDPDFPLG